MRERVKRSGAEHDVWQALVAGAAGGLAGSLAMSLMMAVNQKRATPDEMRAQEQQVEEPTVKVASKVVNIFGKNLREEHKKVAGPTVHFTFGTALGALYGVLAEVSPATTAGFGTIFGTAVFTAADQFALPILKLTKKPTDVPQQVHVGMLVSHAVYGAVTELVRRGVLAAFDAGTTGPARDVRDPYRRESWPVKRIA